MATWEVAIAVCDETEVHRKKEGDIIAFKPAPWDWGRKETNQYLIATIEGMTQSEMVQLCRPLLEDGQEELFVDEDAGIPEWSAGLMCVAEKKLYLGGGELLLSSASMVRTKRYQYTCVQAGTTGENEPTWPTKVSAKYDSELEVKDGSVTWRCTAVCQNITLERGNSYVLGEITIIGDFVFECVQGGSTSLVDVELTPMFNAITVDGSVSWKCLGRLDPIMFGKRKFNLPLDVLANGWMPTLDLERVRDKKVQYQPLKESGITINATEEVAIFQNKFTGKYKYKDFKVFGDGGEGK